MQITSNNFPIRLSLLICFLLLTSCSNDAKKFFSVTELQINKGYKWHKLDSCRPVKNHSFAFPIVEIDGQRIVCFTLKPPLSENTLETNKAINEPAHSDSSTKQNENPSMANEDTPSVIWNFSNF